MPRKKINHRYRKRRNEENPQLNNLYIKKLNNIEIKNDADNADTEQKKTNIDEQNNIMFKSDNFLIKVISIKIKKN